jgi:hypothetical protein
VIGEITNRCKGAEDLTTYALNLMRCVFLKLLTPHSQTVCGLFCSCFSLGLDGALNRPRKSYQVIKRFTQMEKREFH